MITVVSGELFKNDYPMRSFRQLFVLVPQSVNTFYIQKSLFYFQDEIFSFDDAHRLFTVSLGMVHPPPPATASISRSVALVNIDSLPLLNSFLVPLLNDAIRQPANLKTPSQIEEISSTLPVTLNEHPTSVADKEEAMKMKNKGNRLIRTENFKEALEMYTKVHNFVKIHLKHVQK